MSTSVTNEQSFEWQIEKALVGSTREERGAGADVAAQSPEADRFFWGKPSDMDKALAIDTRRLWSFLKATQSDRLEAYRGQTPLDENVPQQIAAQIKQFGILEVLRKGVDVDNIKLDLWYPRPGAGDSASAWEDFAKNEFSVTRQQTFSLSHPGDELDMVVFVNGLPLFTFELKNPWTGQTARYNGQKQYREDRDPRDPLLNFGRCLAHFTLDKDEVFFTTRLAGKKTAFMPFNKGLPDGQGAGNPDNPNGFKTSYLWERVLTKATIADIIQNYALFDYGEAKSGKKVPHVMKNVKKLIFPRYHQLDVVDELLGDVSENGVGKRYLIQHSAGSGKSNSLTWLAYKLIGVCPRTMEANRAKGLGTPLFDTVLVVTDRRILDRQITDNIKAFGHSANIVAHADSSQLLKTAIENGKRIVITTIQKFPFICGTIGDMSGKNFGIIIDEAHSSQGGVAAGKMNAAVQRAGSEEEADTDELIRKLVEERKMSPNASYFAFTATPKRETLERFGVKREDGHFHPFHLYSMKQAIEEGFILDVLTNYTTFRSYYEIVKSARDNPAYNSEKAQKKLRGFVERQPETIAEKADVMMSHFDANLFRNHRLCGHAKALVVTKDIECAIQYHLAICKIIRERRLPYRALIAFSGEKNLGGHTYTEAGVNGFADTKTAEEFEKDENRILVVANKYITGFDQPKLAAMYVDKPLAGVLAVQCLSRLNRAEPDLGKTSEDLFVLDFYNKVEDIKDAFDPFYTSTTLSGPTDINVLSQLKTTLLGMGVFTMEDEVEPFAERFFRGVESAELAPYIDPAARRFNEEIDWPENGKADFKMKCKQFVRVYSRVAAIMPYTVVDWEKLMWYLRHLIPCLVVPKGEGLGDLLDKVDLSTYGLRQTRLNESIVLDAGEATIDPNAPVMVNAGSQEEEKDPLDRIVKEFNEHWFKGWEATPDEQKAKFLVIARAATEDPRYASLVVGNPNEQAVDELMSQIINSAVVRQRRSDMSLYSQWRNNEEFRADFEAVVRRMIANQEVLGGALGERALPGDAYAREDGEGDYAMAATGERRYG